MSWALEPGRKRSYVNVVSGAQICAAVVQSSGLHGRGAGIQDPDHALWSLSSSVRSLVVLLKDDTEMHRSHYESCTKFGTIQL